MRRAFAAGVALVVAAGLAVLGASPLEAQGVAQFVEDRGRVSIISFAGNYDRDVDGESNREPRRLIGQEFFQHHPDEYDFLVAFTTFEFETGEARAFHAPIRNEVEGINLQILDLSGLYGSAGRLRGFTDMAAMSRWEFDPLKPGFESTLAVGAHELLHQWAARVRFKETDGSLSDALIGQMDSHWSHLLDTDASVLYGNDWRDNGDGTFTSTARLKFYSALDLYLAGFYGPDEVPPFVLIDSPGVDPDQLPVLNQTVTGVGRTLTIDDIIAAEGPRVPSAEEAPHEFRAALILVTRPGEVVTDQQIVALNRYRDAFMARFAALTGGRGIVEVYPAAQPDGSVGAPEPVGGGVIRPTDASLADALTWLRSVQDPGGFWEDRVATRSRDTAVTLATLAALDPFFDGEAAAIDWLTGLEARNTDFLARAAVVLESLGADSVLLREALLEIQNPDGGWGIAVTYASDPLDTALAILALSGRSGVGPAVLQAAGDYLLANQGADGGWGIHEGGASRTVVTTSAMRALHELGRLTQPVTDAALAFLATKQNPDGGFGDSPSTSHDTALVIDTLVTIDAVGAAGLDSGEAAAYLTSRQTESGSWDGSTYATSLVVNALQRFDFPNLFFPSPITAAPASPRDGDRVRLTIVIRNDGNGFSEPSALRVFLGDPDAGGAPIGPDLTIPSLASGQQVTFETLWDSLDSPGTNTLVAVIDPDGLTAELSRRDNRAEIEIEVAPAVAGVDLEVAETDLTVTPPQPAALPTVLGISATVRNIGLDDAPPATVRLLRVFEGGAEEVLGEVQLAVPGRASSVANFTYTLTEPGSVTFLVRADPENLLVESSEINNEAVITVATLPALDLEVTGGDIRLLGDGSAFLGEDVTFEIDLRNRGTLDSPQTEAVYTISDGITSRELRRNVIQLEAGQTATQSLIWRVDLIGDLSFSVELDPGGLVSETDEANNTASLAVTAGEITEPNLSISRSDLSRDPIPALEGLPLDLTLAVRNTGGVDLTDVEVAFFDGDPDQGGTVIEAVQVIPSLLAGESATVELTWPRVPAAGERLLFALVDPNDQIAEFREEDNSVFEILDALSLPDAAVSPASLELTPGFPAPGEPVTLEVTIANLGEQAAADVLARAYDGDPASGGVQVGGDQVVASIPASSEALVSFSWTFATDADTRPLVVVVDPDATLEEGREDNNTASIEVAIQDRDFFVTERYFSPNGDGVKDSTRLFFRLEQAASVKIEIEDQRSSKIVRSHEEPGFDDVENGDFEWDGRDDRGRLVRDGEYLLRLVDATGTKIDETLVTVDTNRFPLLRAAGSELDSYRNLTCELPNVSTLQFTEDESSVFFYTFNNSDPVYPVGIYRMDSTGADIRQIVSAGFFSGRNPSALLVSPDVSKIAFRTSDSKIWVANADGTAALEVTTGFADIAGFTSDAQALVIERDGEFEKHFFDGFTPSRVIFDVGASFAYEFELSPDGNKLLFTIESGLDDGTYLLDFDTESSQRLSSFSTSPRPAFAWSPDAQRIALTDLPNARVRIFDGAGIFETEVDLPTDIPSDLPYSDVLGVPELDRLDPPVWSGNGAELAVRMEFLEEVSEFEEFREFARIVRVDVGSGEAETVAWTELESNVPSSYHVLTWADGDWVERGVLHYGLRYREQQLDLTEFLPDAQGDYKVRIRQIGQEAAHVEMVSLLSDGNGLPPELALETATGAEVTAAVTHNDSEVLDLFEAEMDVRWSDVPEGRLALALVAREETLTGREVVPFAYPAAPNASYHVLLGNERAMRVDGIQTEHDGLAAPLFSVRSRPDTGHPKAPVAGFASSDGETLYGALDFAVDNTLDRGADWASMWVEGADGWREFRVTAEDSTWGAVGFTNTSAVHHRHKYYEFEVPLAEIGALAGDTVAVRFEAYGTAAQLPTDEDNLLLFRGDVLWDPNDRALLYAPDSSFRPSTAIFLEEGGERKELFDEFDRFQNEVFLPSGRRLIFDSADARNDPISPCYLRGTNDTWAFRTLANLTGDLRPRRSAESGGILVDGTAADLNFDSFRLEYSDARLATPAWSPIGPPSGIRVVDDRLTTWVPPRAGSFLLRLTVEDLAGNTRRRIKRVSFADTPSITDLFIDPRIISPNGDGVLDDLTVQYRVLEPVHLEFDFFDAEGRRVRNIQRDHAQVGAVFDLVWDGRDDSGLPVPDGNYVMRVQNYEFFVEVDNTPPAVTVELLDARQPLTILNQTFVDVAPAFAGEIEEKNFQGASLETGVGPTPAVRTETLVSIREDPERNDVRLASKDLSLTEFVNRSFELSAVDEAGNRTVATTGIGNEELIVFGFGPHELNEDGTAFEGLSRVAFVDPVSLFEFGPVRFEVAESIRAQILQMSIQFRPEMDPPGDWFETPITEFYRPGPSDPSNEIPAEFMEIVWDLAGVEVGTRTEVRLKAVDALGGEHFSEILDVLTDGLTFRGVLESIGDAPDEVRPDLQALLQQAELNPATDLVLWATELVAEDFAEATVFLRSEDDPRYATPLAIPAAGIADGAFVFHVEEWVACATYFASLTARTEPSLQPDGNLLVKVFETDELDVLFPCLAVDASVSEAETAECGIAPSGLFTITATPSSLDGTELQLLKVEGPDENGEQDLLFTVNQPVSGQSYSFELDTEIIAEGAYPLIVSISNINGDERETRGMVSQKMLTQPALIVDRTPPTAAITFPSEGARVCGLPRDGANVVDIEGLVADNGTFSYSVSATDLIGGTSETIGGDEVENFLSGGSVAGSLGTLADKNGEFTVALEALDRGGAKSCTDVTFFFDGLVDTPVTTVDFRKFSPNGDGSLDETTATVAVAEAAVVDVDVHQAIEVGSSCEGTGTVVRSLASGVPILDSELFTWDGLTDGGATAADGWYEVVASYVDACGNQAVRRVCVELDNTPPAVGVTFPGPADPLPMVIEVVGTVTDKNFQAYSVDFGLGLDPDQWARLDQGARELEEQILAVWNTFGLDGDVVLRVQGFDLVGNVGEVRVPLFFADREELIASLEATPRPFSPNGDDKRETATLLFGLAQDVELDLTIYDESDVQVRSVIQGGSFASGSSQRTWDGLSDSGTLAPDGSYRAELFARLASNPLVTQRESVTLLLDATPPVLAPSRPLEGDFVPGTGQILGSITDFVLDEYVVSITDTPGAPVWVEIDRGQTSRTDFAFGSLSEFGEGDFALRFEAVDLGEIESELIVGFTIDRTPPVVTLTMPEATSFLTALDGPEDVVGSVEEDNLAFYRLEVGAGADPATFVELASGTGLPLPEPLFSWDVSSLADGLYTLRLVAEDLAGQSAEARVAVTVDNTAPTVAVTDPADGGYVSALAPIEGTASDDNLALYVLSVAPGGQGSSTLFDEIGRGTASVAAGLLSTWVALPPDGLYTLKLEASDLAGNTAETLSEVTVDTVPPDAPIDLTAELEAPRDARLDWTPSTELDLAGYAVYRNGVRITATPIVETTYLDTGLVEGVYLYRVTALDAAGLESDPSNEAEVVVDLDPPETKIFDPRQDETVSGLIDVVGTAYSADDFKEYRLFAIPESGGPSQLLIESPAEVRADVLAQWNTVTLPEGARFTLRLEAEDLSGNVGVDEVSVVVDNTPPAAPTGLTATANGSDILVAWNANSEPDLFGYLLYRDDQLANVEGAVIGDLRPVAILTTEYSDLSLPDGTYTYVVYAMDEAGNISEPSLPDDATIDLVPPAAVIAIPEDGFEFEGNLFVQATTDDNDVAEVLFQVRPAASATWTDLGTPDTQEPWEATWFTGGEPLGDYSLRAVATDQGGLTDSAPAEITVSLADLTAPAAVLGLVNQVNGGDVTLQWDANAEPDLAGYHLDRASGSGPSIRITSTPITDTSFVDAGLPDAAYVYTVVAVDTSDNESIASGESPALVYTPDVVQPLTPTRASATDLSGSGAANATVTINVLSASGPSSSTAPTDGEGDFTAPGLPLEPGSNVFTVFVTDAEGNVSKTVELEVVSGAAPSQPTGLAATAAALDVTLTWNANPEPDILGYRPFRNGEALLPETDIAFSGATASSRRFSSRSASRAIDGNVATFWEPAFSSSGPAGEYIEVFWATPKLVAAVDLRWYGFFDSQGNPTTTYEAADFDLQAWNGAVWIPVAEVRDNQEFDHRVDLQIPDAYATTRMRLVLRRAGPGFFVRLAEIDVLERPLEPSTSFIDSAPDGEHTWTVTAVNELGFESVPSEPVGLEIGDVEPPEAVVLAVDVTGSDALLSWTASSSPDVALYEVFRDGDKIGEQADLGDLTFLDGALSNGVYRYAVRPVDGVGNLGELSNEVDAVIDVAVPEPPINLAVTNPATGEALDLAWAQGGPTMPFEYRVLRSLVGGGPYESVATTAEVTLRDSGLENGVEYFYVVEALDTLGNASAPSNEASGIPTDEVFPEPPVLSFPGYPGRPFETLGNLTPISGSAEPATTVSLFNDGSLVGQTTAAPEDEFLDGLFGDFADSRLSPDGKFAWYDDNFSHFLVDFEDGDERPVFSIFGTVRWLPDSSGVAYLKFDEELTVYDIETGTASTLDTIDFGEVALPHPDGRRILVLGQRAGDEGIWVFDRTDETWTLLVDRPTSELRSSSLRISPSGDRLAYQAFQPQDQIEILELASGDLLDASPVDSFGDVRWAPDGASLLYLADSVDGIDAFRWTPASDAVERLTVTGDVDDVVWAPDGRGIVYQVEDEGFFLLSLDTGETRLLLDGEGTFFLELDGPGGGYLLLSPNTEAIRLSLAGRFEFENVALSFGDNPFIATATDSADNESAASETMIVRRLATNLPDLGILALEVAPATPAAGQQARATLVVENLGPADAPASEASLSLLGPSGIQTLLQREPVPALAAGSNHTLVADFAANQAGTYRLVAAVDPVELVTEVSETNNAAEREFPVAASAGPVLGVSTDRAAYASGEDVAVSVELVNYGDTFSGRLEIAVVDGAGFEVAELSSEPISDLAYNAGLVRDLIWNTGSTFAAGYHARARLLGDAGELVLEAQADFVIEPQSSFTAELTTDRAAYVLGSVVRLSGSARYASGNVLAQEVEARFVVREAGGNPVFDRLEALGDQLPGTESRVEADFPSAGASPGLYTATFEVRLGAEIVASAGVVFDLLPTAPVIDGSLSLSEGEPVIGNAVVATFAISNTGGQDLSAVPVRVSLVTENLSQTLASSESPFDLPSGQSATGEVTFETESLALVRYLALLQALLPDGSGGEVLVTLDTKSLTPVDATPPEVSLIEPEAGFVPTADVRARVIAFDVRAEVSRVEVRLDGGAWQDVELESPEENRYGDLLMGLAEGEHQLEARAFDAFDNVARTPPTVFTVDTIAPEILVTGVQDGEIADSAVTPVIEVVEVNPSSQSITLNGDPFVSGTTITEPGTYVLAVEATDLAGNSSQLTLTFQIGALEVSIASVSVAEGSAGTTPAILTVSLSAAGSAPVTVDYASADASAIAGADYEAASGTVTFDPGTTEVSVTVNVIADLLDEPDETFLVDLANPQGASLAVAQAVVTILDDDDPPSVSIADVAVAEGDAGTTSAVFTVALSGPSGFEVSVDAATADASAVAGADYAAAGGSLIFPAGTVEQSFVVEVLGDLLDELDEQFLVELANPVQATLAGSQAAATILDDDAAPTVTVADVAVTEGDAGTIDAVFALTLSAPSGLEGSVDFGTTDGSATAGSDYEAAAGTVTFAAGETVATVTVAVLGDVLDELDETFTLEVSNAISLEIGTPQATATILDDDAAPTVSVAEVSVTEGDAGSVDAVFALTLSAPSGLDSSVDYATTDGSATAGSDYEAAAGTVTFAAGETSATVTVAVLGDLLNEPDETFFVELTNPVNLEPDLAQAAGTILDDDEIVLSIDDAEVEEGDAGATPVELTVSTTSLSSVDLTVDFATEDETATAGQDYTVAAGVLTIPAGASEAPVTVDVLGDALLEPDETFRVVLSNPSQGDFARSAGAVTIRDDELCPGPILLQNPGAELVDAAGELPGWTEVLGLDWQQRFADPLPAEGAAYFFAGPGDLAELRQDVDVTAYASFIASGQQIFHFQGLVRTFDEVPADTARVVVEFRDASNTVVLDAYDSGEVSSAEAWLPLEDLRLAPSGTGWIRIRLISSRLSAGADNDGYFDALALRSLRTPVVSVGDTLIEEGDAGVVEAVFAVSLNCPVASDVSVSYQTADGTAVAPDDYQSSGPATLTLPAGSTSADVRVDVLGDTVEEDDEFFFVDLSDAVGAAIGIGRGTGLIADDDGPPFCPRGPGYWKNHLDEWPVSELELGGVVYDAEALLAFLRAKGKDASLGLARQLTATKLNLASGSEESIQPVVDQADAFLAVYPPGSDPKKDAKKQANRLKKDLEAYNDASCDDEDSDSDSDSDSDRDSDSDSDSDRDSDSGSDSDSDSDSDRDSDSDSDSDSDRDSDSDSDSH